MAASAALDPAGRAAVLIMLLEEPQATALLAQLDPAELRILGEKMCALGEIDPVTISRTVGQFMKLTEHAPMPPDQRVRQVEALMSGALGEMKAHNLMQSILPQTSARPSSLELAKWLNPEVLVTLVEGEHPQAIAVLLVQLDPQIAAKVLHCLPDDVQSEVVHRIATLGAVSPEAIAMLEELLDSKIAQSHGAEPLRMGGPSEAAEIINKSTGPVEKQVMSRLAKIDKALARRIESEMFRFEHLYALDNQAMGAVLREVESEILIDALKGIGEAEREVFFSSMSSRAADGVRDEIDARGRLKLADVQAAQQRVIDAARRLAADGTIIFGSSSSGDDDYV